MRRFDPIVVDNGSGVMKIGFAGDDEPVQTFETVVSHSKHDYKDWPYIIVGGQLTTPRLGVLNGKFFEHVYPINRGVITNWDDMERIWHHAFYNVLAISPDEHPVLLTEPPLNPRASREKMTEIMFEIFDVRSLYVAIGAVLSLYASGRTSGLVVDSGDGNTFIVPMWEGFMLPHAVGNVDVCGREVTEYLEKLLVERGYKFRPHVLADQQILVNIKEKFAYVAIDFDEEEKVFYGSPDKINKEYKAFQFGNERYKCTEILFDPSLLGIDSSGISSVIHDSYSKCDKDIQSTVINNVVLAGGNTMIPGFSARVQKDLEELLPVTTTVNVISPSYSGDRSAWLGGSILGSLSCNFNMWIRREEFDEFGPTIVHRKCY